MSIVVKEKHPKVLKCWDCKSTLEFEFADCIPVATTKQEWSSDYTGGRDCRDVKVTTMMLICPVCNRALSTDLNPTVYSKEK